MIVNIAQTGVNFKSPGKATDIKVEFSYPAGALSNLTWTPALPAGWAITSARAATGTVSYVTVGGATSGVSVSAAIGNTLGTTSLTFWVTASVPGNQASITAFTNASVALKFTPAAGSEITNAVAMRDEAVSWRIHSADYQSAQWVIDAAEMNRVLAYWRSGGYNINPLGLDGYVPGFVSGDVNNARHSADYATNGVGVISAAEAARVIGFWRGGGAYHVNASTVDGYGAGATGHLRPLGASMHGATLTQTGPDEYDAGGTVTVSCALTYTNRLLSLSWKPVLPAGWQIIDVSGEGKPEIDQSGGVLWIGSAEFPNPLVLSYTLKVPLSARGTVALGSLASPMLDGIDDTLSVPTTQSLLMTVKDADGNGIADGWEKRYFGATGSDPLADPDRDGMNNLDESIANTEPDNAQSVLITKQLEMNNGMLFIRWQSASNKTYSVLSAKTPAGVFETVEAGIPATPPENVIQINQNTGPQFLRVLVEP